MLLSPLLFSNHSCEIDRGGSCVNCTHGIESRTCVESEVLCDTRNFVCRQHDAETKECVGLHSNQSHHEKRCLHEGREAKGYDLFAPTGEALRHSSRKAEKIETAYGNLREKDAAPLDIREEALDHAVTKADNHEQFEQYVL